MIEVGNFMNRFLHSVLDGKSVFLKLCSVIQRFTVNSCGQTVVIFAFSIEQTVVGRQ